MCLSMTHTQIKTDLDGMDVHTEFAPLISLTKLSLVVTQGGIPPFHAVILSSCVLSISSILCDSPMLSLSFSSL